MRWPARLIPAYLVLLLALAALGGWNQARLQEQNELLARKENLRLEIVQLRARTAARTGPLAVSRWAEANGMVPSPEVEDTEHLFSTPAPTFEPQSVGLEVRTVWR